MERQQLRHVRARPRPVARRHDSIRGGPAEVSATAFKSLSLDAFSDLWFPRCFSDKISSSIFVHVRFTAGVGVPETVAHLVERQGQGERPKARACEDDELACFLQLEDYLSLPAPRTMQARPNSLRVTKPLKSDHKAET